MCSEAKQGNKTQTKTIPGPWEEESICTSTLERQGSYKRPSLIVGTLSKGARILGKAAVKCWRTVPVTWVLAEL